jgi:uncharacterized damage-inducible protein DinB
VQFFSVKPPIAEFDGNARQHYLGNMNSLDHFRVLARYNRIANERLYTCCSDLGDAEYYSHRRGSFGSIHALLNHILLGDRIWMSRFKGEGHTTPPLNAILYQSLADLRSARMQEDLEIEAFFGNATQDFLVKTLSYINSKGFSYQDSAPLAVLHFFNHQTHHRGQVHVMISQTEIQPPSLDMHRILNP